MTTHEVRRYELLNLVPAPAGTQAAFHMEGGGFSYVDVFAFALAKVTTTTHITGTGSLIAGPNSAPNELVGLLVPDADEEGSDYVSDSDMIAEQAGNFAGYRTK